MRQLPERRKIEKLTPLFVEHAKKGKAKPGKHCDGRNLYLLVEKNGSARWVHRYLGADGKDHWHGLGSAQDVSLEKARKKNTAARDLRLNDGLDPIETRRAKKAKQKLDAAKAMTFKQCAEAYIAAHSVGWKNEKHRYQWPQSLGAFVYPVFGDLPVQAIDTQLVVNALKAIWTTKPETATRVRGRIERILDWARVSGFREGENPARWKGHLDHLLPARAKVQGVEHHAALPYREIPAFMAALRVQDGISARALEFAILTAGRTGEILNMTWGKLTSASGYGPSRPHA